MNTTPALKKAVLTSICTFVCWLPNKSVANCEPSVAKNFPTVTGANYVGSSQTDSFNCAINGGKDLSQAQLEERAALSPEKVSDRFYLRFGLNASSEGVISVKNTLTSITTYQGIVANKQVNISSNNIELAFGYTWNDFAIDLEWLALKSIAYNSNLTGITPNVAFSSTVKGDSLLANVYWNFQSLYNLNFYGVALIGSTNNKCTTILTAGGSPNVINKKYSVSFGAGLGAKFNIISNVYADMAARYIRLGETKFEASNTTNTTSITLKGARRWIGMSIRLLWLI